MFFPLGTAAAMVALLLFLVPGSALAKGYDRDGGDAVVATAQVSKSNLDSSGVRRFWENWLELAKEVGKNRSAFTLDLSLTFSAHVGIGCFLVTWVAKVIFAWNDSATDAFETRIYQYCM